MENDIEYSCMYYKKTWKAFQSKDLAMIDNFIKENDIEYYQITEMNELHNAVVNHRKPKTIKSTLHLLPNE